ncbi:MAG TPA: DUF3467 domain-containing protein [Clostridia bacterium]|nr:DUF3467 domain-containing protein [Clostridia bacterium]
MEKKTMFATEGIISLSLNQFYMQFDCTVPPLKKEETPEVVDRVGLFLSPEHYKSLCRVMQSVLADYENRFGTICTEDNTNNKEQ